MEGEVLPEPDTLAAVLLEALAESSVDGAWVGDEFGLEWIGLDGHFDLEKAARLIGSKCWVVTLTKGWEK